MAQCPMNGKLDITECDNPVLSHRVATATGDLDQLCVDLTFFTFIFSSFIVYVLSGSSEISYIWKPTGHIVKVSVVDVMIGWWTSCNCCHPQTRHQPPLPTSASKSSIRRFVITEKAPTRAISWMKATTAFTFKTLLRHYANQALTPRSLNVKLGPRRN